MEFLKYHALGNDYLVLTSGDLESAEAELTAEKIRKVCQSGAKRSHAAPKTARAEYRQSKAKP